MHVSNRSAMEEGCFIFSPSFVSPIDWDSIGDSLPPPSEPLCSNRMYGPAQIHADPTHPPADHTHSDPRIIHMHTQGKARQAPAHPPPHGDDALARLASPAWIAATMGHAAGRRRGGPGRRGSDGGRHDVQRAVAPVSLFGPGRRPAAAVSTSAIIIIHIHVGQHRRGPGGRRHDRYSPGVMVGSKGRVQSS